MNYEVYLSEAAEAQLQRLWETAVDPEAVMDAIDDVTRILSESPVDQGESRQTLTDRLWFHKPLQITFSVNAVRAEVDIMAIRWTGD